MSASTSSLQLKTMEQDQPSQDRRSWKSEVNERLAAHRTRRATNGTGQPRLPGLENTVSRQESLAARVAARVAERYSNAPTYSDMLAAEAARAAEAAQQARMAAQAIRAEMEAAAAQIRRAEEIERAQQEQQKQRELSSAAAAASAPQAFAAYHQPLPQHRDPQPLPETERRFEPRPGRAEMHSSGYASLAVEVVDPFEEATVAAAQPLSTKLIEFPRELIATRKARPRLAEGPLRDSGDLEHAQLRIFEAEPETHPSEVPVCSALPEVLPEWHSIRLSSRPDPDSSGHTAAEGARQSGHARSGSCFELPLNVAPLEDRLMAAIVDAALTASAFLAFVLAFTACATQLPSGKTAIIGGALVLAGLCLVYQWLSFRFAEATPGMRYAKIALCTFKDDNPSRRRMRGRVAAMLLSALPLGLGFAWVLFDDDRLSWHDRMTRTYQRSYR